MEKNSKKRKKEKKKIIVRIAFLALLVFIVYNIVSFYLTPEMSVVAHITSKEITYEFDSIISRDESTVNINIGEKGIIDPCVSENQMVKKGALIANYYDSNVDDSIKEELNYINQKIAEIKATPVDGTQNKTEQEIENETNIKIYELIDNASNRDVVKIKNTKSEIINLIEQNNEGDEKEKSGESLEELLDKKEEIESKYEGKKEEIFSPVHGIYSTGLDGYEETVTIDKSLDMSVTDFENIMDKTTLPLSGKELPEIKITDSFKWSISICTDEKTAKNFEIGKKVTLRFSGEKDEPEAIIDYISPIKSGKCVITAVSTEYSDFAMKNRFAKVTFVNEKYNGLYVPVKAIRVVDGVTGVYVKTENTVKYREIEVLYKDDKEAIVKIDNTKSNALLLYDEIIVD